MKRHFRNLQMIYELGTCNIFMNKYVTHIIFNSSLVSKLHVDVLSENQLVTLYPFAVSIDFENVQFRS